MQIVKLEAAGLPERVQLEESLTALESPGQSESSLWAHFERWCAARGYVALPASEDVVRWYLADHHDRWKYSAFYKAVHAVRRAHLRAGYPDPCGARVTRMLGGQARRAGRQVRRVDPIWYSTLRQLVDAIPAWGVGDYVALRMLTMLRFGFFSALRGGELCAFELEWITDRRPEGIEVTVPVSKTDPTRQGQAIVVHTRPGDPLCGVAALDDYCTLRNITTGPVFTARGSSSPLSLGTFSTKLQELAAAAGLSDRLAGHSPRRGFASQAIHDRAPQDMVSQQLRHRSPNITLMYVDLVDMFSGNAHLPL